MGGELLRWQWVVGGAARFADLDDTIDHELALVFSPQRHPLVYVHQRGAEELLLFLARGCWKDDEAGMYGLSLAELAEITEIVRYKGPVLVDPELYRRLATVGLAFRGAGVPWRRCRRSRMPRRGRAGSPR